MSDKEKDLNTQPNVTPSAKETSGDETLATKYGLEHRGGGRYRLANSDKLYPSKKEALKAAMELEVLAGDEDEFGDLIPKGWDRATVTDRALIRNSPMELAMNERYLADGSRNPYYDREWEWTWAHLSRDSISQKRAQQFQLVTLKELTSMVREGRVPEHIESLVYEEGEYLIHKDAVLMRIPRFILTRRRKEREAAAVRGMTQSHRDSLNALADENHIPDSVIASLDLENSLEVLEVGQGV